MLVKLMYEFYAGLTYRFCIVTLDLVINLRDRMNAKLEIATKIPNLIILLPTSHFSLLYVVCV